MYNCISNIERRNNMKLTRSNKEVLGTCIQIFVFVLLIPFTVWLLRSVFHTNGTAFDSFVTEAVGKLPYGNEITAAFRAIVVGSDSEKFAQYLITLFDTFSQDMLSGMCVALCMRASRIIFKEIIPIPGIPLMQLYIGLVLGILTLSMLSDFVISVFAVCFIIILNVVLTILTVKPTWKKVLDIFLDMSLEFFNYMLLAFCVILIGFIGNGYDTSAVVTVYAVVVVLFVTQYMLRYLLVMKR